MRTDTPQGSLRRWKGRLHAAFDLGRNSFYQAYFVQKRESSGQLDHILEGDSICHQSSLVSVESRPQPIMGGSQVSTGSWHGRAGTRKAVSNGPRPRQGRVPDHPSLLAPILLCLPNVELASLHGMLSITLGLLHLKLGNPHCGQMVAESVPDEGRAADTQTGSDGINLAQQFVVDYHADDLSHEEA